jgi:abortive infection bacteriophage resistance protein
MRKLAGFFCPLSGLWMTQYLKPPLSIQDQLEQLQRRGLSIGDAVNADRYLRRVGYYRLMGYLYTQRVRESDSGWRPKSCH